MATKEQRFSGTKIPAGNFLVRISTGLGHLESASSLGGSNLLGSWRVDHKLKLSGWNMWQLSCFWQSSETLCCDMMPSWIASCNVCRKQGPLVTHAFSIPHYTGFRLWNPKSSTIKKGWLSSAIISPISCVIFFAGPLLISQIRALSKLAWIPIWFFNAFSHTARRLAMVSVYNFVCPLAL